MGSGGAGGGGILEKFFKESIDNIQTATGSNYDLKLIESTIEKLLAQYQRKFRSNTFRVLVAVFNRKMNRSFLFRNDDNALTPIQDYAHVGVGASLWRFFVENLHDYYMTCDECAALAAFILREAKRYVADVDGPTQIVAYKHGTVFWKHYTNAEIKEIENKIPADEFSELHRYWRSRQTFRRRNEPMPLASQKSESEP